jgi:hypothetical protein
MLQWVTGNSKLAKLKTIGWGIPANIDFTDADGVERNTCPRAGACAGVCYAKQGQYVVGSTKAARARALAQTMTATFAADAIADLTRFERLGYRTVRVHDSGDFYSQSYLNAWYAIARALPGLKFYSYTKSLHLDLWSGKPGNFQLVQSEGGKMDDAIDASKPHSRIFSSHAARRAMGYGDGSNTDTLAIRGHGKIGLVYHGPKKLTAAQTRYFGAD